VLLFILSWLLQPLVEPDFGWHLRTGLDLLKQGWRVPATDPYSHTMPDWPWVEHAWLTDGLIALIYEGLGPAGPLGVIVFFAAVTGSAVSIVAGSAHAGRTCKLFAISMVLWTALPFLGARTQMVTLLGFALVLRSCMQYRVGALTHLWGFPPLFFIWANLHGGFTAGLFTLGLILAGSAMLRLVTSRRIWHLGQSIDEPVLTWPQTRHLALVLVVSTLATLVNPYGWRLHHEIFTSLTDRFMIETLHEWQSVSFEFRAGRWYIAYVALLGAAMLLLYRRREPLRWLILSVFLVLSLRHWRNVPFFLLVSVPLCADMLEAVANRMAVAGSLGQTRRWLLSMAVAVGLGLIALGPDHVQAVARCGLDPVAYFRGTDYPIEAVAWIKEHRNQLGTRLYNDYGQGGFLLWWLPGEKIFIDGRMPAWRVGDRWIFYDYIALTAWDPPELGVLSKYHVDWALVGAGTPLGRALASQGTWQDVYRDAKVTIYVKR
jgi:hypothetical protein